MEKANVTVRLEVEKIAQLDQHAESVDRDRSYLIKEAIDQYLEMKNWQAEDIRKAIAEADAGQFMPEEDIEKLFEKWVR